MADIKFNSDSKIPFPWKLGLIFLLFSFVIIIMGIYYYHYERNRIFKEQEISLSAIASLKINQISQWYSDKLADAVLIKDNEPLIDRIKEFLKDENQTGLRKEITVWLEALNSQYDYNSVAVLDTLLRVRLATSNTDPLEDDSIRKELNDVIRYHKIRMTDLHKTGPGQSIRMDLLVPLLDPLSKEQKTIGLIILCIDPGKILFPLVQSWPTPSKSSETLILRMEGDSVLYLNDLRNRENSALNLKFPTSNKNLLAVKAVNGFEGVTEGVDYRNVPVIGAIRKIQGLPWYMVAKTDKNEILEPFQRYSIITVVVIILLLILNFLVFGNWVWSHYLKMYRLKLNDEIALRKSEEQIAGQYYTLKGIIESSGGPIFSLDITYCYTSFNKVHYNVMKFLYRVDIEIGKNMLNYQTNKDDRIKSKANLDRALAGEYVEESAWSGEDVNTRRFFEVTHNPILNDVNEVIGVAVSARDLTQRKEIDERLHETNEYLSNLFNYANAPIIVWDTSLLITRFNHAFENLSGYTAEEVIGRKINILFSEENAGSSLKLIEDTLTGYRWETVEINIQRKDKESRIVLWNSANIHDKDGKTVLATIAQGQDITVRKKAEESLKENEILLQRIIDNSNSLIYIVDTEGRFLLVNQPLLVLLSTTRNNLIGQTRRIFLSEEIADMHRKNDLEIINTGKTIVFEEENIETDGKHFYLTTKFPLYNNHNKIYAVGGLSIDITGRKLSEDSLRESEDKFKYIFDHSVIGKSITLPTGEIQVNKAFCDMLGYSPEELKSKRWQDFTHQDDVELNQKEMDALIAGKKESARFYKRYLHKNGKIVWTDIGSALRRDDNGHPLYFLSAIINITDRKNAEESLRLKNFVFDDSIAANSISDINGIITDVNAAFLRIWGYQSKGEVIGKSIASFLKSDAEADIILNALEKEGEWEGDYSALRKDSSTFIAHGLATSIKDEKGNGIGYQSAALDVTAAKRTEEKIKNQLEELKRFNASMVDREIRMIQLKHEINAFCNQLNLPEKYSIPKVKD